jgi:hypothetical protein
MPVKEEKLYERLAPTMSAILDKPIPRGQAKI